ncbi:MAG: HDOD domain-containing protein [Burkholderiales bacterium]|nr:HDOD domain-containing protein [Burkholderiales bacterium]
MASTLKQFLQRLFGAPAADVPAPASATAAPAKQDVQPAAPAIPPAAAAPPAKPAPENLSVWKPALPLDALFFDWLMGHPDAGGHADTEQNALQALYRLLASDLNDAVVVPRVPTVIPQLLSSLRSKSISTGELSRQIVRDVVLVGEVINTVNSALYNPADRISSLDNAVMMLGEEGLRLVIAKVAFRPIINLNAGHYTRRAAPLIWTQSEKCAIACHSLTPPGADPFHAFLAGLMKNVGLIVAFRLLDQVCEQARFGYSPSFHATFSSVAATLSYRIAQRWEFPPQLILALQQQSGGSKAIDWSPLGRLLHDADLLSKMRLLANHGQLKAGDKSLKFGLSQQAARCFDRLNEIELLDLGVAPPAAGLAR